MSSIETAARALKAGKPAIFPTDTVYGMGVAVKYAASPDILYQLKQREARKPVAWLVGSLEDLHTYGRDIPAFADVLARTFWPGALTLVVKASERVPAAFRSETGTIGLRMPADATAQALIAKAGSPLATTSANFAGLRAPRSFAQVDKALLKSVVSVDDNAEPHSGTASTVLDCALDHPIILREGAITVADIRSLS